MKNYIVLFIGCMFAIPLYSAEDNAATGPDDAMKMLKDGNSRYVADELILPNTGPERRKETDANGQHPFATILSCSDSREPAELIFDRGIGDLFIVRVAGNVASTDEIGSVEYGAEHLRTPVVLVLGHTRCGAVTAVAQGDKVGGSIPSLVAPIVPAVEETKKRMGNNVTPQFIDAAIRENIRNSMASLLSRSEIIRELVKQKKLMVTGALYHLDTGNVEWLGPHPDEASLLSEKEDAAKNAEDHIVLPVLLCFGTMAGFYFLVIAKVRLFKSLNIRIRLVMSLLSVAAGTAIAVSYSLVNGWHGVYILSNLLSFCVVAVFGIFNALTVISSFRSVISKLSKIAEEAKTR